MADASGDDVVLLLLRVMPADVGDTILGRLGAAEAARLRARLSAAPPAAGNDVDAALAHFFDLQRIAERPAPPPPTTPEPPPTLSPVEEVRAMPPETLARALDGEQPGTVALVLSCLDPIPAGQVMQHMPMNVRAEVTLRMLKLGPRNQALLDRLLVAVTEKGRRLRDQPRQPSQEEVIANIADMLRAVPRAERLPVVKQIEAADPELAAKITEKLYRIEDLLKIPDRQMQTLLGKLDVKTLAIALKGADPKVFAKVSANLSTRSREVLADESSLLGTVQSSRVKEAQAKVIAAVRKGEEDGEITPEE